MRSFASWVAGAVAAGALLATTGAAAPPAAPERGEVHAPAVVIRSVRPQEPQFSPPLPPVVQMGADGKAYVHFTNRPVGPDVVRLEWWVDGVTDVQSMKAGETVTVVLSHGGLYTFHLRVTDAGGVTATTSQTVQMNSVMASHVWSFDDGTGRDTGLQVSGTGQRPEALRPLDIAGAAVVPDESGGAGIEIPAGRMVSPAAGAGGRRTPLLDLRSAFTFGATVRDGRMDGTRSVCESTPDGKPGAVLMWQGVAPGNPAIRLACTRSTWRLDFGDKLTNRRFILTVPRKVDAADNGARVWVAYNPRTGKIGLMSGFDHGLGRAAHVAELGVPVKLWYDPSHRFALSSTMPGAVFADYIFGLAIYPASLTPLGLEGTLP